MVLCGFQKDLENSIKRAYISRRPRIIRKAQKNLPGMENISYCPENACPKPTPQLVNRAIGAVSVVSISKFSREIIKVLTK